jgi:hypothetical protein
MRRAIVVLVAALMAGAASVSAQQPPADNAPAPRPWFATPPRATPLGDLMPKPTDAQRRAVSKALTEATARARGAQPKVIVCGMTLVPADPAIDPSIRHAPPADGPAFAIQSIVPRDCQRNP